MNPLVPPVGAAVAGALVALLFVLVPGPVLEDWVWASGIPALVSAAAPPLGATARAVLALGGGGAAASVTWSVLYLLFGPGGLLGPRTRGLVVVPPAATRRRATAPRDLPPRRPMTAADLGTPLMEVRVAPPVERPVPVDLDQPLSAFDPAAIPLVPLAPTAPVAPLARTTPPTLAPGERIETYVLDRSPLATRPFARATTRQGAGSPQPTIDMLLRRLEDLASQRIGIPAR